MPHELLKDLKLRMLGNEEILEKSQNCMGTQSSAQAPLQICIFRTGAQEICNKVFCSCLTLLNFLIIIKSFCLALSLQANC